MDKRPIFAVSNHHVASCGEPPCIDDSKPKQYRGYFENAHGEQAIFVYDRAAKKGTLYMGDAGWDEPRPVKQGRVPGLIMGAEEQAWLAACWQAATGKPAS
jgi:hypothetical protein